MKCLLEHNAAVNCKDIREKRTPIQVSSYWFLQDSYSDPIMGIGKKEGQYDWGS